MTVQKNERRYDSPHLHEHQTKRSASERKIIQKPKDSIPVGLPNFTLTPPYLIKIEKASTGSSKTDTLEKKEPTKKAKQKKRKDDSKRTKNLGSSQDAAVELSLDEKDKRVVLAGIKVQAALRETLPTNSNTEDSDDDD